MKDILKRNGFYSLLQVIVTGGVYFFLYKYLFKTLGVELLGIWSLVLVTVSAARLSELGFASSVVKFVAKYRAQGNGAKAGKITETALLTVLFIVLFVSLLSFYPLQLMLGLLVPEEKLSFALMLLPYALFALCINTISGVLLSALDGCQRIDIRSILMTFGILFNLILVLLLLPEFGFIALAYSQLIQAILILFVAGVLLKRELPSFHFLAKWNKEIFQEIWRYAVVFQLTSVVTMLYEPVTKGLLSYFGGLSMVGYYEMANRMVMQFRSLIVSVNRIFVPAVAEMVEVDSKKIRTMYLKSYEIFFVLTIVVFSLLSLVTPAISLIWIGESNNIFIYFSLLLIIGWAINTFIGTAFFFNQGTGYLRPNLIVQVLICLLNIILGTVLGYIYGGFGVVIGWVLALIFGSLPLLIEYHLKNEIPLKLLVPKDGWYILLLSIAGISASLVTCNIFEVKGIVEIITIFFIYTSVVFLGLLNISIGKYLFSQFKST